MEGGVGLLYVYIIRIYVYIVGLLYVYIIRLRIYTLYIRRISPPPPPPHASTREISQTCQFSHKKETSLFGKEPYENRVLFHRTLKFLIKNASLF